MNWVLVADIAYALFLVIVCLRIIYDTRSAVKTLAWLLFVIFVPVIGIVFYFTFGINYRRRRIYSKKLIEDESLRTQLGQQIISRAKEYIADNRAAFDGSVGLVRLLVRDSWSPLSIGNKVDVLTNGEEKFPVLLDVLKRARHHIHIQYYIFEEDGIGTEVKNVLIEKARQGVKVRFIYDAFGSGSLRRKFVRELKDAGVEVYPFNRVRVLLLANRLNYRNHRKIVIVDGKIGLTGGINVSDRYINGPGSPLYWRDTHLLIHGPGVHYLQYLFLCDWNFASGQKLVAEPDHFQGIVRHSHNVPVQIAASGPDSPTSTIMLSLLKAMHIAQKKILITTPYFIPGESVMDTLKVASLSGVTVRLLVPHRSDSTLVNAAARSYYTELLKAGVQIFQYTKGFIHAKTIVIDDRIAIVGSANMDYRSFEMNFEVNAILYDEAISNQLTKRFEDDLRDARQIDPAIWERRSLWKQLLERIARLLSPLL